jgi:hypothetical protein
MMLIALNACSSNNRLTEDYLLSHGFRRDEDAHCYTVESIRLGDACNILGFSMDNLIQMLPRQYSIFIDMRFVRDRDIFIEYDPNNWDGNAMNAINPLDDENTLCSIYIYFKDPYLINKGSRDEYKR